MWAYIQGTLVGQLCGALSCSKSQPEATAVNPSWFRELKGIGRVKLPWIPAPPQDLIQLLWCVPVGQVCRTTLTMNDSQGHSFSACRFIFETDYFVAEATLKLTM